VRATEALRASVIDLCADGGVNGVHNTVFRITGRSVDFMLYNFARVHQTLRVTPAMEACVSDHVWNIDEIVVLLK
jgi:hypothetical protein